MLGAIAGDIIGSMREKRNHVLYRLGKMVPFTDNALKREIDHTKREDFELFGGYNNFTDDSVMTLAVADAIMNHKPYGKTIKDYGRRFPNRGYGGRFRKWLKSDDMEAYNSYGNGSAMRVSPVGFAFDTLEEVLAEAKASAEVTHNHPQGVEGAQAVAAAVFMARTGESKEAIRDYLSETFEYPLADTIEDIRPTYKFDATCEGSVPESIIAFLDSNDFEHAVRLAVSLGGDADTQAAIAGSIAQAYYKQIPANIVDRCKAVLGTELWQLVEDFQEAYKVKY
ncbi:hypothetical protein BKI52_26525 [marine bacterium AO1-C]|nr:hypothetical protein BKI52_26525 [marine bacterium AO1-C]